jgi:hypothetical protein
VRDSEDQNPLGGSRGESRGAVAFGDKGKGGKEGVAKVDENMRRSGCCGSVG